MSYTTYRIREDGSLCDEELGGSDLCGKQKRKSH
jgi:hypothetical protein